MNQVKNLRFNDTRLRSVKSFYTLLLLMLNRFLHITRYNVYSSSKVC